LLYEFISNTPGLLAYLLLPLVWLYWIVLLTEPALIFMHWKEYLCLFRYVICLVTIVKPLSIIVGKLLISIVMTAMATSLHLN